MFMFSVTGYRIGDGLSEKAEIRSGGKMSTGGTRVISIAAALVICGVLFLVLKVLFPGRSSTWYMNRIKILASIILLIGGLILLLTKV